jgi:hypothetical protein
MIDDVFGTHGIKRGDDDATVISSSSVWMSSWVCQEKVSSPAQACWLQQHTA